MRDIIFISTVLVTFFLLGCGTSKNLKITKVKISNTNKSEQKDTSDINLLTEFSRKQAKLCE